MRDTAGWRDLFPFESRYLNIGGARYHYVDEGRGDTLLLVHGNPTWSFYFRDTISALRNEYRVIAVDHFGCGLSEPLPKEAYTLASRIHHLSQFVSQLDLQNATLVGHDWGGAIGLGAVLAQQARFSRLVLMNTGAWPPDSIPRRIAVCKTPLVGKVAVQGFNVFLRAAFFMAMAQRSRLTQGEKAGYLAPYRRWRDREAIYEFVRDIPANQQHPTYATLAKIENQLHVLSHLPVQLIWGMKDWCFTPDCLDRFLTHFPQASARRIDRAGHWVVEDAKEEVIDCLRDFLKERPQVGG